MELVHICYFPMIALKNELGKSIFRINILGTISNTGVRGKDGRWLCTAPCGKRAKWPSERRTPFSLFFNEPLFHLRVIQLLLRVFVEGNLLNGGQISFYLIFAESGFRVPGHISHIRTKQRSRSRQADQRSVNPLLKWFALEQLMKTFFFLYHKYQNFIFREISTWLAQSSVQSELGK